MLEKKETYTLRELINALPIPLRAFGRKYGISEVTLARLRDGKPGLRSTTNKLLTALSETYHQPLTYHNVEGIVIRGEAPSEKEGAQGG